MRTQQLALAAALAAAVFSANAAPTRMEPVNSPFTYEALGATPTLVIGRAATRAAEAPQAAEAVKAAEAPKPAAAPVAKAATTRTAGAAPSPFTYEALGATPHVEVKKQPARSEVQAPAAAH